jgi:hypothetical protein
MCLDASQIFLHVGELAEYNKEMAPTYDMHDSSLN